MERLARRVADIQAWGDATSTADFKRATILTKECKRKVLANAGIRHRCRLHLRQQNQDASQPYLADSLLVASSRRGLPVLFPEIWLFPAVCKAHVLLRDALAPQAQSLAELDREGLAIEPDQAVGLTIPDPGKLVQHVENLPVRHPRDAQRHRSAMSLGIVGPGPQADDALYAVTELQLVHLHTQVVDGHTRDPAYPGRVHVVELNIVDVKAHRDSGFAGFQRADGLTSLATKGWKAFPSELPSSLIGTLATSKLAQSLSNVSGRTWIGLRSRGALCPMTAIHGQLL
eukprot:CAMPEP_0115440806 /NCGR_PEP_ID=MMETSP0271-20121206/36489_1 /TAXON_ID=71861 /ORGANISM="Scrippsiella trochoidea, Strain CCMP3099" /LENGTH=286 /DNA_ID=CAMNT_0002866555 /DNA_START=16 /DNA_END=878 /DNA_ORIENTATION=-